MHLHQCCDVANGGDAPRDDDGEGGDLPDYHDELLAMEEALKFHEPGKAKQLVMKAFGISPRTADRRIAQVKASWASIREQARPIAKAQHRRVGMQLLAEARAAEQYAAAATIWNKLADLDGLNEPQEFRDRTERPRDLSQLTDAELAEAKRLAAKTEGPKTEE